MQRLIGLAAATVTMLALLPAGAQATYPGKNGRIAFVRAETFVRAGIVTVNPDGSGEQALGSGGFPSWSADGSKLVFQGPSPSSCEPDASVLLEMSADGSGRRQVYDLCSTLDVEIIPNPSPDGSEIAFEAFFFFYGAEGACLSRINRIAADGTSWADLGQGASPRWSPNGARIAFNTNVCDGNPLFPPFPPTQVFTMGADGSGGTNVSASDTLDTGPDWSPDGRRIAFRRQVTFDDAGIWVMNADGGGQTRLTSHPTDRRPVWSPDGAKIAFARSTNGCCSFDVFVMNADGSGLTQLTTAGGDAPSWQPLPGPRRADYKNAAHFCKAERDFLGEQKFAKRYGTNGNGANAFGKCVSRS